MPVVPALNDERAGKHVRKAAKRIGRPGRETKKIKRTISLSGKSIKAFDELRRLTDADTESEVVRNALRLHLTLIRAYMNGAKFFIRHEKENEAVAVNLFVDVE